MQEETIMFNSFMKCWFDNQQDRYEEAVAFYKEGQHLYELEVGFEESEDLPF